MKTSQRVSEEQRLQGLADIMINGSNEASPPVSVAGFARTAGINRSTLYSSYPDIVRKINDARASSPQVKKGRDCDEAMASLRAELSIARRQRREAVELRDLYALQIRILTEEVQKVTKELEARVGVTSIEPIMGLHRR